MIFGIQTMRRVVIAVIGLAIVLQSCRTTKHLSYQQAIEIPFRLENNFIIIDIVVNQIFPLQFIFDTGAEHTLLTRKEITDLLRVEYTREFTVMGADMQTELYAYLAPRVNMISGELILRNKPLLVLEEDYFQLDQQAGVLIHGIMGSDLFRYYVVLIDYERQVIQLIPPEDFKAPSDPFIALPIEIDRGKPYIRVPTELSSSKVVRNKLLLDTGASLSLILYTNTQKELELPPRVVPANLAIGLGGYLQGYIGRVNRIDLGRVNIKEVVTNFQELEPNIDQDLLNYRHGILGNQLLSQFSQVVFDYIHEKIYLLPHPKRTEEPTNYDRSGLVVIASGPQLNEYIISQILPGSPASATGLQAGDQILSINGLPTEFLDLKDINQFLQRKEGKRIKLKIRRDKEKYKYRFELKTYI